MVGIVSHGAYVPFYRIDRKTIFAAMGWLDSATRSKGEKAICNFDEDSVTMSVAAATNCLKGFDRDHVDGVYLATASQPAIERQASGITATALDIRPDIRTADFTGSTKAGTTNIIAACDAIKAGSADTILTCAADCRTGKPGSPDEQNYGDAAAAFLFGDNGVIAEFEGSYSVSYDFMGHWMGSGDEFGHSWESRWVKEEGYVQFIVEAISGLLQKHSLEARDIAKVIYPSPNSRDAKAIAKKLKLEDGQVQDSLFDRVGDCGTASPLLMLSAALDDAEQGDRILVASYGNGSDALLFRVTDDIARTKGRITVAKLLARKHEITNYNQYLTFRGVLPVETGIRGEEIEGVATQISRQWRERKEITALCGSKCKKCGTPQYPYQRVCVNPDCGATDEMEYYRFSDKKGALFTYTVDNLAFTFNPPQAYGVMAFEGGGKYWFDITDCDPDQLEVGMPMEMSFRRKYLDKTRGISGYFWKAVPALV